MNCCENLSPWLQFAMMETVISALYDEFPIFQTKGRKMGLTLALCIILFALGLPQCARVGGTVKLCTRSRSVFVNWTVILPNFIHAEEGRGIFECQKLPGKSGYVSRLVAFKLK